MSRRILLIYTGGTLGMVRDEQSGALISFALNDVAHKLPELKALGYHIDAITPIHPIDSSEVEPDHWQCIAQSVSDHYNDYDGFVVLHGTDTMAYTASALSYMLDGLTKPVVLTGSQLPLGFPRTDARENLVTAIELAGATDTNGNPRVPEVGIYFDYRLFRGNRASKFDSDKFQAFQSPNYPALAEVGTAIRFQDRFIRSATPSTFQLRTGIHRGVAGIRLFPGMSKSVVVPLLESPENRVLLMETFGMGNAPTHGWLLDALRQYIRGGRTVVSVTQCRGGYVDMGRYHSSTVLREMGVVSGRDMTFEAAVTKIMWLLGNNYIGTELEKTLVENLRGELTEA
ncbi:MAG: asparaginase [Sphingomonadales bacterium]|nr:asparaginase [Sphingomonadales bacterium]